jgi:hypothetical protein
VLQEGCHTGHYSDSLRTLKLKGNCLWQHTHKVSALWPPKHEKGIPLTKTAAAYRRQNDDHTFLSSVNWHCQLTVSTTASTLNVSVWHLTADLCEDQCRRLQNTDTDTLAQSSAVCPSHDTHKTNITCRLWEPLDEFIQNLVRISEHLSHHRLRLSLIYYTC